MQYTKFGSTGLTVSRLCLGTMTFGLQTDETTSRAILDTAAEAGINFLDTADVYPLGGGFDLGTVGRTEEIIGRWLEGRRSRFIVATKAYGRMGHIHGLPADMDEILALGQKYNLVVIEDACQAHGATYRGRNCGTIGAMACFSLNATKNLSGGEGGFVNTDDEEYWERAKMIRTFGEKIGAEKEKIRPYFSHTIGWNYRTQELPAAFARSQLQRLPRYNAIAQRNGQFLSAELGKIAGLIPPYIPDDRTTIYHKYRLRFDPQALGLTIPAVDFRNRLIDALEAEGVEATLWHVTPLPSFPVFQRLNEGYVQGTPWLPQVEPPQVKYIPEEYPEAQRLMDESIVVNSEPYPIFLQDQELMECYVAAFRKVFDNLDELAV
jgi:dTDP-4-amino-4,6-dideoxygalactose transaminase